MKPPSPAEIIDERRYEPLTTSEEIARMVLAAVIPTRERLARLLHQSWSNGFSSWEQDDMIQPAFFRQADAVIKDLKP